MVQKTLNLEYNSSLSLTKNVPSSTVLRGGRECRHVDTDRRQKVLYEYYHRKILCTSKSLVLHAGLHAACTTPRTAGYYEYERVHSIRPSIHLSTHQPPTTHQECQLCNERTVLVKMRPAPFAFAFPRIPSFRSQRSHNQKHKPLFSFTNKFQEILQSRCRPSLKRSRQLQF